MAVTDLGEDTGRQRMIKSEEEMAVTRIGAAAADVGGEACKAEWSTLIGPDPSKYCALIGPLTRNDTAQGIQSPLQGWLLMYRKDH